MNINVTVEGIDGIDLTTVIADRVRYDEDGDRITEDVTIGDRVAEIVARELTKDDTYPGLRKRFLEIREEEIRAAVKPIVADALAAPIQKTNSYGEPTSATTTMRELIIAEVSRALNEKADRYNSSSPTFLHKAVAATVRSMLDAELKAVFDAEKAKIVAAVKDKAADLIADAVKQGVGR